MLQRDRWGVKVSARSGHDSFDAGSKGADTLPASDILDRSQLEVSASSHLKSRSTLDAALEGIDTVVCTASSTMSRREGDSIETVDQIGVQNLIDAAGGKIRIYGDGKSKVSYVTIGDVAEATIACVHNPKVFRSAIPIGGLKPLSQLEAVSMVEQATGRKMQVEFMSADEIAAARKGKTDAVTGSFLGLFDSLAHGDEVPAGWSQMLGVRPQTLEDSFSRSQQWA